MAEVYWGCCVASLYVLPPYGMLLMRRSCLQAAGDFTSAVILPVDIEDVGDAYNFVADVPGLEKGDIKVRILKGPTSCVNAHCAEVLSTLSVHCSQRASLLKAIRCKASWDTPSQNADSAGQLELRHT